ncbi:Serine/threonine-protein phosphatase 1 [compost metagenome]
MTTFNPIKFSMVKTFSRNIYGRDFVVGDIHGHFDLLLQLLKKVNFNTRKDRIFSVGDLVDRGPHSKIVTDWLNKSWFHAVRGNHEQMIIDCAGGNGDIPRHTRNGGAWFYNIPRLAQVNIFKALCRLPLVIEVELSSGGKIGIVHAEPPLWKNTHTWLDAKQIAALKSDDKNYELALYHALYSRTKIDNNDCTFISGIDNIYVGHSTVPRVTNLGNVVYIDTGCSFGDGALSLIDINSGMLAMEIMPPQ